MKRIYYSNYDWPTGVAIWLFNLTAHLSLADVIDLPIASDLIINL